MFDVNSAITDATPILHSGVLPLRRRGGIPKVLNTGLIIGVILIEVLALVGGMWNEHGPAIFLALLILAISIHELGHVIAGWALGFSFASLQVGPAYMEKQYGVLRLKLSFDMTFLGHAAMYADNVRKLRRRLLIYTAGGPAANIATVVIVLVSQGISASLSSGLETAAGQLAAISLSLAIVSLFPFPSAINDGALIQMLFCCPMLARRQIATAALGAQFNQGVRARNWKQTWINAATYIPDKSTSDFYSSWMAYLSASDRKELGFAAQYLERCLQLTPVLTTSFRDMVAQEAAVFNAWFRRDPDLAEKWLLQLKEHRSLMPVLQARIDVALKCAHGDYDGATSEWGKGFALIQELPATPAVCSLKESWLEWRLEIQERRAQLSTV